MANNFESNITRVLLKKFLPAFENSRSLSKNVNTQLFNGRFNPSTGGTIDVKRPTDYVTVRNATGDLSSATATDITTGKASATVQDYFTTYVTFDEADEAIKMDQLDELLMPQAQRIVTDMELDFAEFMLKNSGLYAGTYGTPVTTWNHVADAGATLDANGIPRDKKWCYAVNPFTQTELASNQRSLGAGDSIVESAHERNIITKNFAGMDVMTCNTLASFTSGSGADRVGALAANPDVTYLAAKDTMQQTLSLSGFEANLVIKAGEIVQIAGRNRLNQATRKPIIDGSGNNVLFTGVVQSEVTLDGSGAGTIVVSGPAIYEATGPYNTTDSAAVSGDVVTLLGSASTLVQPNLFWHPDAFTIASVPIKKLKSTDTVVTTKDGLQIRCSYDSDVIKNQQIVRFDFRPAYGVLNPFFSGQSFGS